MTSASRAPEPSAVVLDDLDLVRTTGWAGARVTLVASPADPDRTGHQKLSRVEEARDRQDLASRRADAADAFEAGRAVERPRPARRGQARRRPRADGRLRLLEIDPRVTLWANLGAVAGMNLVALARADLHGRPWPACAGSSVARALARCAARARRTRSREDEGR